MTETQFSTEIIQTGCFVKQKFAGRCHPTLHGCCCRLPGPEDKRKSWSKIDRGFPRKIPGSLGGYDKLRTTEMPPSMITQL